MRNAQLKTFAIGLAFAVSASALATPAHAGVDVECASVAGIVSCNGPATLLDKILALLR